MRVGLVGGRWKIVRRLGKGGFAEVYEVEDTRHPEHHYALKIGLASEKGRDSFATAIKNEYKTLQKLHELGCRHLVALLPDGLGEHDGSRYMVMELAGPNMADLQPAGPDVHWDPALVVRAGLQSLAAVEGIHQLGWLHRDVKPSNFVVFPAQATLSTADWRILDFGTARRFKTPEGELLQERQNYHEFRGSTSYASVNAHLLHDLGRVDDLWSWLYMCAELWSGQLPWRRDTHTRRDPPADKDAILDLKQRCQEDPAQLMSHGALPDGLRDISNYLRTLEFGSEPDYGLLRACLASLVPTAATSMPAPSAPAQISSQSWDSQPANHAHSLTNGGALDHYAAQDRTANGRLQDIGGGSKRPRAGNDMGGAAGAPKRQAVHHANTPALEWSGQNGYHHHSVALTEADSCQQQVADFADIVQQGNLSKDAWTACSQLATLDPAEGLGVMAWMLNRIAACVPPSSASAVAPWLDGLGQFAQQCARQCLHKQQRLQAKQ